MEQTQLRVDVTDEGVYELLPAVLIPQDQLWYHSPEGRERLRRGEASFAEGHSTRTSGEADTQRFLDSMKTSAAGRRSRRG